MMTFITAYGGTIFVSVLVIGIVTAIVAKLVKDKKKGKLLGCDCGCGKCPKSDSCHTN